MSKINKRASGISMMSDYKPKSKLNLEGEHAETVTAHPIGRKVKMTVHATKSSHSMNSDGTHSASYEINKIENEDNEQEGHKTVGKAQKIAGKEYSKHQSIKAPY